MKDLNKRVMSSWVEMVDGEITTLDDVDTKAFKYCDDEYAPSWNSACSGAYWVLRSMMRDSKQYEETRMRMDQYFHTKCMAVLAAFYSITDVEE